MVSVTHSMPKQTRDERAFWQQAFIAAIEVLGHKATSPDGLAHLASDIADAALTEFRRRFTNTRE